MVLAAIFDPAGSVSGWSEADRLYSPSGRVIGWVRAGGVYSLAGMHVGWLERGHFRDDRGCVVAWTPLALGGPRKPATQHDSCPASPAKAPVHPSYSRRMARIPFLPSWSSESWKSYLVDSAP